MQGIEKITTETRRKKQGRSSSSSSSSSSGLRVLSSLTKMTKSVPSSAPAREEEGLNVSSLVG
jgi:hypothetical protein